MAGERDPPDLPELPSLSWFAAHELFTRLHHIRARAEALLAGNCGALPLPALEAVGTIADAARRLEADLRDLQEIERLRGQRTGRAGAASVPLRDLLPETCTPPADPRVRLHEPQQAAAGLARLLEGASPATVRVRTGRRWVALTVPVRADAAAGEGEIALRLAQYRLAAAGARVRRRAAGLLVLLPLARPGRGDGTTPARVPPARPRVHA